MSDVPASSRPPRIVVLSLLLASCSSSSPCPAGYRADVAGDRCVRPDGGASSEEAIDASRADHAAGEAAGTSSGVDAGSEGGAQADAFTPDGSVVEAPGRDPAAEEVLSERARKPQVAANRMGRAVVVWEESSSPTGSDLWVAIREEGGSTWSKRKLYEGPPNRDAAVVMDELGNITVSWRSGDAIVAQQQRVEESGWRPAHTFSNVGASAGPSALVVEDGNVTVCWAAQGRVPVCASVKAPEEDWYAETRLGQPMTASQLAPLPIPRLDLVQVAWVVDKQGTTPAQLWLRFGGVHGWPANEPSYPDNIFKLYDVPDSAGVPTGLVAAASNPDPSTNVEDVELLLWHEQTSASTFDVRLAHCQPFDCDWTVRPTNSAGHPGSGRYPHIAVQTSGTAIGVWSQGGLVSRELVTPKFGVEYVPSWGPLTPIAGAVAAFEESVRLVSDESGTVFAMWAQKSGNSLQLTYATTADSAVDTPLWSAPLAFATLPAENDLPALGQPVLAGGPEGRALAAWIEQAGAAQQLKVRWLQAR